MAWRKCRAFPVFVLIQFNDPVRWAGSMRLIRKLSPFIPGKPHPPIRANASYSISHNKVTHTAIPE
jgi:hypothetical protein